MPESGATREPTHRPSSGAPVQMLSVTTPIAATSAMRSERERYGLVRRSAHLRALATSLPASATHCEYFSRFVVVAAEPEPTAAGAARAAAARAAEAAEAEPAELREQLVERLGVGGLGDLLVLVEVGDREVELDVGRAGLPGALGCDDAERDDHPAQDRVLLAGVDLDARVLDRVDDLLLLRVGELRRELVGALDAELARLLSAPG